MTPQEWAEFAAELEATFRGGLEKDRERACREHFGKVPFEEARAVIARLVRDGQVFVPTPAELVGKLRSIAGGSWRFECLLAGESSEERRARLLAQWQGADERRSLPSGS